MIRDVWKKFDEAALSHSSVHHLLAINTLQKEQGYVRGIDVANYLQLTRGSVSLTLKKLKEKGYILEDHNKFLRLSEKGQRLVNAVLSRRRLVHLFFSEVLGVPGRIAEEDACKVEHLLTKQTSARLLSFLGLYLSENKKAVRFRDEFRKYSHHCDTISEQCHICEIECYFANTTELENDPR